MSARKARTVEEILHDAQNAIGMKSHTYHDMLHGWVARATWLARRCADAEAKLQAIIDEADNYIDGAPDRDPSADLAYKITLIAQGKGGGSEQG